MQILISCSVKSAASKPCQEIESYFLLHFVKILTYVKIAHYLLDTKLVSCERFMNPSLKICQYGKR